MISPRRSLALRRGLRAGGAVLRVSPKAGRAPRLAEGAPELQPVLEAQLKAWDLAAPGFVEVRMSEETRKALEALGYLE